MFANRLTFLFFAIAVKSVTSRSFTVVVDTTDSMQDELDIMKNSFPLLTSSLANNTDFNNFIVVPFNDPGKKEKNTLQHHHHQPIIVPTAGAQVFLMDYT
jgi:hypothetical protein